MRATVTGTTKKRPGAWWYAVAAGVALAGIIPCAVLGVAAARSSVTDMDRFAAPGQLVVRLPVGEHRLSYEQRSVIGGEAITGPADITRLACQVASVETGEPVILQPPNITRSYTMAGYEGTTLHRFETETAGEYLLTCDYPEPGVVIPLAIGEGFTVGAVVSFLVGITLSFIVGVILFWFTFVRRRSRQ
ncbi:MAG TPA: hypothetical protein VML75_16665 [Kofleriaceae bacterium]|nr:hypothetical protein [Kofleriaceae bacterium]